MPIPWGYHEGNRSEYLAAFALSKVGFVVPVPRQSDYFKVDFIVHLARQHERNFIPTGRCFAIQIKSDQSALEFKSPEDLGCIHEFGLPLYLGIISRKDQTLSVYPTLPRLLFGWQKGKERSFRLIPGGDLEARTETTWSDGNVYLGPPIIDVAIDDLDDPQKQHEASDRFADIMERWICFEELSLSWRRQGIPLVAIPESCKTGAPPNMNSVTTRAFSNPKTLPTICRAIQPPLYSLGFYLHDFCHRFGGHGHFPAAIETKVQDLDDAVEQVKNGCRELEAMLLLVPQTPEQPPSES